MYFPKLYGRFEMISAQPVFMITKQPQIITFTEKVFEYLYNFLRKK